MGDLCDRTSQASPRLREGHSPGEAQGSKATCPFCPGDEASTPPEIFVLLRRGSSPWSVRVVPNKFAALAPSGTTEHKEVGKIYREMEGVGAHEVIIETPEPAVWSFLKPFIEEYDAVVFTMEEFCPPDLETPHVVFIPPAIDPLSTKNMDLPAEICKRTLANSGVDLNRPLLLQVSRFDPWKDQLGVIKVYCLVKEKRPEVQLALVGAMAGDDPEGWRMLQMTNEESAKDKDMYVFTNLTGVGNMEVNAFQRGADVVIQKSLRKGFGLVVSEALWKGKPVVAGRAGGIPMQFPDGYHDYLVSDVESCAVKVLELLQNTEKRMSFGKAGQKKVRRRFLLPRLIRDELKLVKEVLGL